MSAVSTRTRPANGQGSVQHQAWNKDRMDRWLPTHRAADVVNGPYAMGCYDRQDIPFQFALADALTICDACHCSMLGPTWPNRMMWMTGTIDPGGTQGGPVTSNTVPPTPFRWTTYVERLLAAGISWKSYHEEDDAFGCDVLVRFQAFADAEQDSDLYERAPCTPCRRAHSRTTPATTVSRRCPGSSRRACSPSTRRRGAGRRRGPRPNLSRHRSSPTMDRSTQTIEGRFRISPEPPLLCDAADRRVRFSGLGEARGARRRRGVARWGGQVTGVGCRGRAGAGRGGRRRSARRGSACRRRGGARPPGRVRTRR